MSLNIIYPSNTSLQQSEQKLETSIPTNVEASNGVSPDELEIEGDISESESQSNTSTIATLFKLLPLGSTLR